MSKKLSMSVNFLLIRMPTRVASILQWNDFLFWKHRREVLSRNKTRLSRFWSASFTCQRALQPWLMNESFRAANFVPRRESEEWRQPIEIAKSKKCLKLNQTTTGNPPDHKVSFAIDAVESHGSISSLSSFAAEQVTTRKHFGWIPTFKLVAGSPKRNKKQDGIRWIQETNQQSQSGKTWCDGIIKNAFRRQALRTANWVRVAGENGISLVRGAKWITKQHSVTTVNVGDVETGSGHSTRPRAVLKVAFTLLSWKALSIGFAGVLWRF